MALVLPMSHAAEAPTLTPDERQSGMRMLETVRRTIYENHFNPKWHGFNLNAAADRAEQQISRASTQTEVFRAIAGLTHAIGDGETIYVPPASLYTFDYGWFARIIGPTVVVSHVDPTSDAADKGLRYGDQLVAIDGAAVTRENARDWEYLLQFIEPRHTLTLTVSTAGSPVRELKISTRIRPPGAKAADSGATSKPAQPGPSGDPVRPTFLEKGRVLVWRQPAFQENDLVLEEGLKRLPRFDDLILDLRGNSGGREAPMLRLLAVLLGKNAKVGRFVSVNGNRTIKAELGTEKPWPGRLLVLVDSGTSNVTNLLACTLQRENRALLLGDRTNSRASDLKHFKDLKTNFGTIPTHYSVVIACGRFESPDGHEFPANGLVPDFLILPGPADLAARRDPVLALALKQFGVVADPAELGKQSRADDGPP